MFFTRIRTEGQGIRKTRCVKPVCYIMFTINVNDNNESCVSLCCYPPTRYKLSLVRCGCGEILYQTYHCCRIWMRFVRKENYKTENCSYFVWIFFYVMTMRFTNWYIYIIWTTTFLCVWWHFDKTVMTSLAVKKVKFKYSLIEICIYDYKCIMINWVKFITRLITFLY